MRTNSQKPFKERILETSRSNNSRIVLAVDLHDGRPLDISGHVVDLVKQTCDSICSVKFGRQTILSIGPDESIELLRQVHNYGLTTIIDDKLNDIDETNEAITRTYSGLGFDALTVNPFAGWEGGLESTFTFAHDHLMGVIALVYMSHPAASEGYGQQVLRKESKESIPQFEVFAKKAVEWHADGAVVGATRPEIVQRARAILGKTVPIFSPGVGTQGGDMGRSLKAGTDYFIIGRSITRAQNPGKTAQDFARASALVDA